MKGIHEILSRLDEIFSSDKLPFQKEKAEVAPPEPREPISFKGFWKENFSIEAIKHKWADCRESYSGSGEAAKKKRKTAAIKAVLMCISILLAVLSGIWVSSSTSFQE